MRAWILNRLHKRKVLHKINVLEACLWVVTVTLIVSYALAWASKVWNNPRKEAAVESLHCTPVQGNYITDTLFYLVTDRFIVFLGLAPPNALAPSLIRANSFVHTIYPCCSFDFDDKSCSKSCTCGRSFDGDDDDYDVAERAKTLLCCAVLEAWNKRQRKQTEYGTGKVGWLEEIRSSVCKYIFMYRGTRRFSLPQK